MIDQLMEKIEFFENERASGYDAFTTQWIPNYDFVIKTLPKIIEAANPKIEKILVAGCGTGNEIISLHNYNPRWKITGADPSPEMLQIAERKITENTNIKLHCKTVSELPPDGKFDAATLLLVLHFMEDDGTKELMLKSISERLNPGAPLVLMDIFGTKEDFGFNLKLLGSLLSGSIDSEQIRERLLRISERIYPISEPRLTELLLSVGFSRPVRFFQSGIYAGWVSMLI